MRGFLRRLRGIIGTGLTWAVVLGGIATGIGFFSGGGFVRGLAMTGAFMGFIVGGGFALILSISERHKNLKDLSLRRVAIWGGLGGVLATSSVNLIGGSGGILWDFVLTFAILGAGLSAGTVAIAKRASEPKLIEGDDEPLPVLEGE